MRRDVRFLVRQRLKYVAKIVMNDPSELIAMLSLTSNGQHLPWVKLVRADLKRFVPFLSKQLRRDVGT